MRQLGGIDNLMIEGELPNIPMHMSALMIYGSGGKRGATRTFKVFNENFERIVDEHFPILRCRIEELPLDLDKAYWVEDEQFNAAYHISRVALPAGRNWAALYAMFNQFHAQPLDRTRPLWQATLVEGLDNLEGIPRGSTALFLKIHHAVMDGKSAIRLVSSFHTSTPEPDAPLIADSMPPEQAIDKDFEAPTWWEKYGRAWWHSIERPIDLAGVVLKLLPGLLHQDSSGGSSGSHPTPPTLFNHPVSADRVVGHIRMDMAQLKRLKKKFKVSINDIALCVVGGALRSYLLNENNLPEDDLQALMPVDLRRENEDGSIGNHVTVAKIALGTSIEDCAARLRAIHAAATIKKRDSRKGDSHALLKLVDDIHPAIILWLGQWLVSSGRMNELPQIVNTVVTNVPGLSGDAYLGGAQLIDYIGFGPLAPNMTLFHTVSSTTDHVNISFLSTADTVGDGSVYRSALADSWTSVADL